MKHLTLCLLIVFVGCSRQGPVDPNFVWPDQSPATPNDNGSAGSVGSIRDGIQALTKLNEEIDAARRNGGKVTIDVNLPTCSGKECSTCQSCVPESSGLIGTGAAGCASAQPTKSSGSSGTNGAKRSYRRGLFGRRVYTSY